MTSTGTATPVLPVSGLETEVTVLLASPLDSSEPSTALGLSVGGGVGGAVPTKGARGCSMVGMERLEGCGEDLWELGGVVDVAWGNGPVAGEFGSKMSFSMATICLP